MTIKAGSPCPLAGKTRKRDNAYKKHKIIDVPLFLQEDFLSLPYHQALLNNEIPLSIGGGIGQSRTY
ncbi:MAG: hypothetical protein JSV83_18560, partial [Desulfobacterales bacterium]